MLKAQTITNILESDFNECVDLNDPRSYDDHKFMELMKKQIYKCDDGHYEMPLPIRDENLHMPDNKPMAESRLKYLKGKFMKNPKLFDDYKVFMNDLIDKGYAEEVPVENPVDSLVWYIPHHGIYNPKKNRQNPRSIRLQSKIRWTVIESKFNARSTFDKQPTWCVM